GRRGRIGVEIAVGQEARADPERLGPGRPFGHGADDHLGGAAAHVHHGDRAVERATEGSGGTEEREPALLVLGEDAHRQAALLLHRQLELALVLRGAHGRRGHDHDLVGAELAREPRLLGDDGSRLGDLALGDPSLRHRAPDARERALGHQLAEPVVARLRHEQAGGVAADVDAGVGHAHSASVKVSFGRSRTFSSPRSMPARAPFFIRTWAPVAAWTAAEKSGSWPTSSASASPTSSSGSNGPPFSRSSTVTSMPSDSHARRAVSRARFFGLERQTSTLTPSFASAAPAARACLSPSSVSGRWSSGRPSAASPCLSSQIIRLGTVSGLYLRLAAPVAGARAVEHDAAQADVRLAEPHPSAACEAVA